MEDLDTLYLTVTRSIITSAILTAITAGPGWSDIQRARYDNLVAITSGSADILCTGVAISPTHVLTAASCVVAPDGTPIPDLSVIEAMNLAHGDRPGSGKTISRHFPGAAYLPSQSIEDRRAGALDGAALSQDFALLQIGLIEGREGLANPTPEILDMTNTPMAPDEDIFVLGYQDVPAGVIQAVLCEASSANRFGILLDCALTAPMRGALAFQGDTRLSEWFPWPPRALSAPLG